MSAIRVRKKWHHVTSRVDGMPSHVIGVIRRNGKPMSGVICRDDDGVTSLIKAKQDE